MRRHMLLLHLSSFTTHLSSKLIFLFVFKYAHLTLNSSIAFTPLIVSYTVEVLPFALRAKGFNVFNFAISLSLIFNQYVNPIALDDIGWKYYVSPLSSSLRTSELSLFSIRLSTAAGLPLSSCTSTSLLSRPRDFPLRKLQPYLMVKTQRTRL
jgi:hypothetical protein